MISFLISLAVSLAIVVGAYVLILKNLNASVGGEKDELIASVKSLDQELEKFSSYSASYGSKGQFDTLIEMVNTAKSTLENEIATLKDLETKLDSSQKNVETKEFAQQELKSAKEEDETKLAELMAAYNDVSNAAIELENELAQSLKNLDQILEELNLNDDQRVVFDELSDALTTSGSLLRELITEYNSTNERLKTLQEQHEDLEDEYTRLVEQQLGE